MHICNNFMLAAGKAILQCRNMMLDDHDLQDYFTRIGFTATPRCDEATLRMLHALHALHIPFENLDSWLGRRVSLDPAQVLRKLVHERRGGYCFEHNQLFLRVLRRLGFTVQGLSARVLWMLPPDMLLPRTHMALLVVCDGVRFIADVGFGGMTMTAPLLLDGAEPQATPHEPFRVRSDNGYYTVEARIDANWLPLYRVSLDPSELVDYETANWYVSTHPESRFVQQLIASRPDREGRHALLQRRYTRHLPGQPSLVAEVPDARQLRRLLQDTFGIQVDRLPELDARIATLFEENA